MPTRPIVRYHGGKWRIAPWIISHFPAHRCYVEPFCGAASVFLQKRRSKAEVLNDRFDRIINVFRVLRCPQSATRLAELLRYTCYSEGEYRACREVSDDVIEDARRIIVLGHQGHGSTGSSGGKLTGWRRGWREQGGSSADEWRTIWKQVDRWAERMRGAYIESDDAVTVLERWDSVDTLHYVDPPYLHSTRSASSNRAYAHEMTDAQHIDLLKVLNRLRGAVIVSGYPSGLYDSHLSAWRRIEVGALADRGADRTEVLWLRNVPVDKELFSI